STVRSELSLTSCVRRAGVPAAVALGAKLRMAGGNIQKGLLNVCNRESRWISMQTLKQVAAILLMLSLTVSTVWLTHRGDVMTRKAEEGSRKIDAALADGQRAAGTGADYLAYQIELFKSEPYQKSLKASIDAPAIFNASGRYLNRFILPEALNTVRA